VTYQCDEEVYRPICEEVEHETSLWRHHVRIAPGFLGCAFVMAERGAVVFWLCAQAGAVGWGVEVVGLLEESGFRRWCRGGGMS